MQNIEKYKEYNAHLLEKLLKINSILALNPNGFGSAVEEYAKLKEEHTFLKNEILESMGDIINNC